MNQRQKDLLRHYLAVAFMSGIARERENERHRIIEETGEAARRYAAAVLPNALEGLEDWDDA